MTQLLEKPSPQRSTDELSDADFERVAGLVYRHCGINLQRGKMDLVRARLSRLTRSAGLRTISEYLASVQADASGSRFTQMIDALSTNLTSFFRERNHFDYLKQKLLPRLMAEKKKAGRKRIRAWSAGCSSGEEPYSLAMTLVETIGQAQGAWDVKLLATDLSTRVLAHAKRGSYDPDRISSVPAELRARYFAVNRFEGRTFYDVMPALRQVIAFRQLNLMGDWPFSGPFDFIFCRNVMIYFDKPTQQRLVGRFYDLLSPRGVLFTGHSESLTGIAHKFEYVQPTIYAKS